MLVVTASHRAATTAPAISHAPFQHPQVPIATTGTGTFVAGQSNAAAVQSLNVSRTVFSKTTGAGDNSATWNPTLVVNIPSLAGSGTYTGAVSQPVV
ncbi:hypothetical protein GCM10029978_074550 [Actinoallomurus acanthiterrae]